jgi:hypothetical protein
LDLSLNRPLYKLLAKEKTFSMLQRCAYMWKKESSHAKRVQEHFTGVELVMVLFDCVLSSEALRVLDSGAC